jgi:hypothetical protein
MEPLKTDACSILSGIRNHILDLQKEEIQETTLRKFLKNDLFFCTSFLQGIANEYVPLQWFLVDTRGHFLFDPSQIPSRTIYKMSAQDMLNIFHQHSFTEDDPSDMSRFVHRICRYASRDVLTEIYTQNFLSTKEYLCALLEKSDPLNTTSMLQQYACDFDVFVSACTGGRVRLIQDTIRYGGWKSRDCVLAVSQCCNGGVYRSVIQNLKGPRTELPSEFREQILMHAIRGGHESILSDALTYCIPTNQCVSMALTYLTRRGVEKVLKARPIEMKVDESVATQWITDALRNDSSIVIFLVNFLSIRVTDRMCLLAAKTSCASAFRFLLGKLQAYSSVFQENVISRIAYAECFVILFELGWSMRLLGKVSLRSMNCERLDLMLDSLFTFHTSIQHAHLEMFMYVLKQSIGTPAFTDRYQLLLAKLK